jgi:chromosome segregation ATPase
MSFGFAVGDFVASGRLSWGLYKQCKGASAEFAAVCNEVLSIHTALRELEDEAQNEDSVLNRAGKGRQKELNNIVQNCTEVLQQLEALVTRYRSLGTSQRKVWDRIEFGDEGIGVIRNELLLHTSTLTLFLTTLGTGSLGRIAKKLDDIAAEIRAGQHEPSVITAVNDKAGSSQNEAWDFLSRELAGDFSIDEIAAYRGEIKGYISQLVERGALEEQATSVRSDEGTSHRSTPRVSSPASPVVEPTHSSLAAAELPEIRWPPKPYSCQ